MKIVCQGLLRGKPCGNTLLEVDGAEIRLHHRGRRATLRGLLVSGAIECEDCRTIRYLLPADLGQGTTLPAAA